MHRYLVLDRSADDRRVALLDDDAGFHLARIAESIPPVGTSLTGEVTDLGFATLCCASTGKPFKLEFQLLNGGYGEMIEQLHRPGHDSDR